MQLQPQASKRESPARRPQLPLFATRLFVQLLSGTVRFATSTVSLQNQPRMLRYFQQQRDLFLSIAPVAKILSILDVVPVSSTMKYIFVVGMGRSGTSTVARLLGLDATVKACHEFIGNREYWLLSWYLDHEQYALPFLEREKAKIEAIPSTNVFIDVNGYLQNSVGPLGEVFENASIYHLVRDGRNVVRSLYTRRSDDRVHLLPKSRPEIERWFEFDKFSQVCWNWNATTSRLLDEGIPLLKFEDLVTDFDYFEHAFLLKEGLKVTRTRWREEIGRRHNKTRSTAYRWLYSKVRGKPFVSTKLPEYDYWPSAYKSTFDDICGETMRRLGYLL